MTKLIKKPSNFVCKGKVNLVPRKTVTKSNLPKGNIYMYPRPTTTPQKARYTA